MNSNHRLLRFGNLAARAAMLVAAAAFAVALETVATTPAGARGPAAHAGAAQTLQLKRTSLGSILVDSSGFTVYRFTKDSGAKSSCASSRECNATWPPLTNDGKPSAGPGVKAALISTIALPGGKRQVTYAGHPLYLYAPADEREETDYVGARQFGGTWLAVNASGGGVQ
jgi:predicted lipoprotein with Yx(FWY)xxD motif